MKRKLRTIANRLKTKERVLVTLLFAFVLSCMSIGYAYYQTEVSLEANIKLLKGEFEISSVSVYKTKNSSLEGEIEISKNEYDPNVVLSSGLTVNLTGNDKNNYMNIQYIITNNTNKTYTYISFNQTFDSYDGANPENLRVPKLYGIIPGDKILPGESREVNLIYIASSDVGDSTFTVTPSFLFSSGNPDVAIPSLTASLDSHRLTLGDDGMASVGIKIMNEFETTVKYTLGISNSKFDLSNNSGTPSNYANTLVPSEIKNTTLYFNLLDSSIENEETTFDLIATLEDGTVYILDQITIGKNVIPDLPYMHASTNEEKSENITSWAGHYSLYVDIKNDYTVPISSWTVYAYPKESSNIVNASSYSNTVSLEDGVIKITSKQLYGDNLISVAAGDTYTTGLISIEYQGSSFEIEKYEIVANVESVDPSTGGFYTEAILNGADPVIPNDDYFVPVTISNNGTVTKADSKSEWYKYADGRWANAVILKKSNRTVWYYAVGDTINQNDIEDYVVWIPRYKYKLFNVTTTNEYVPVQVIQVYFETKNISHSTGNANGEYLTHPAFTDINKNGFWIGKFELSNGYHTLPNVNNLRNQGVADLYNGLRNYKSDYNSHMVTNMEWGAAGYLAYSKYGRGTTEVSMNNNSTGMTGCSNTSNNSATTQCLNRYGSSTSYPQSTTGNITGIFDMSGGSYEYVAATIVGERTGEYSTFYENTSSILLGDGVTETKFWFGNRRGYFSSTEKYLVRGGNYEEGDDCTIFNFWRRNGNGSATDSSRIAFDI